MAKVRVREEVINTYLAQVVTELGVVANAETVLSRGQHRPDVLFQLRGLRVVIESKVGDTQSATVSALNDAKERVQNNIAHIAVAVVYPTKIATTPSNEIYDKLKETKLKYSVVSENSTTASWTTGTPADMMESVRRAQEMLAKNVLVEKTASRLSIHLENIAALWKGQTGPCENLADLLGMNAPNNEDEVTYNSRLESAAKVSALVLANAFIFQEQLAGSDKRVLTLSKLRTEKELIRSTSEHWAEICEKINYGSIFHLGKSILRELPAQVGTDKTIKSLIDEAFSICSEKVALRHDLMGRIFHWLLHDAKYLGTFYTSVSAATILLKVAMSLDWETDFSEIRDISNFTVADFASGTGTLLMAATQAITDQFVKSCYVKRIDAKSSDKIISKEELNNLHQTLIENTIHGYDILPTAVHLTASTLALLAPEVLFRRMNLFLTPIGLDHGSARLGSLDFMLNPDINVQLSLDGSHLDTERKGVDQSIPTKVTAPKLDLCVMNPPFTRSGGNNKIFGSHGNDRPKMLKELNSRAKRAGVSTTPGLGSVFIPLADQYVKTGGRIAFVLPLAIATGELWSKVRELISQKYHLEVVIASHESKRTNFSENTDLSEILFIARKLADNESAGNTIYVSLRKNPDSIFDARNVAARITTALIESKRTQQRVIIKSSEGVLGEVSSVPAPVGVSKWTPVIFLSSLLATTFSNLENCNELQIPGSTDGIRIPLCPLAEIGTLGYDNRDTIDAFEVDKTGQQWTPHPAFWDHKSDKVNQISQIPNAFLIPREFPLPHRPLRDSKIVWDKASRILIATKLRTNTHKLVAVRFENDVLGNTWWPFTGKNLNEQQEKALLIWLNSTLGLLMLYGNRTITEGSWFKLNKGTWNEIKILNVTKLNKKQLLTLANVFDKISSQELLSLAQIDQDPIRQQIDSALCDALNLPDLSLLRDLMTRESGLTG